jgi:Family of unknown function (DUF6789)
MSKIRPIVQVYKRTSDVIIDGLFNGIQAGLLMSIYLALALIAGRHSLTPFLDSLSQVTGSSPLTSVFFHLAVSGIYGTLFGGISKAVSIRWPGSTRPWPSQGMGVIFGALLYLFASTILFQEISELIQEIQPIHFLIAHLIYGWALGFLMSNSWKQAESETRHHR